MYEKHEEEDRFPYKREAARWFRCSLKPSAHSFASITLQTAPYPNRNALLLCLLPSGIGRSDPCPARYQRRLPQPLQHWSYPDRECNHPVTRSVCAVEECENNGYSCSMPGNSFMISNNQLPLLEFVIEYTWSPEQRDLDTSTRFLDGNVGFRCTGPNDYLDFGGDNTSNGETEVVVIDVEKARQDSKWEDSTAIISNAGWFASDNQGGAQMRVYLRRKSDGGLAEEASVSDRINPGTQSNCSSHKVAAVKIIRGSMHTRVTLEKA
ncbi:hypothetical protein BWQ96_05798 [Gracilariopsis chorda]|uniref:Uncharacterized protein n=1 Tax=Gracilariopsis chorda TaxID=448386 RepID=A0A2V3ITM8_9FLOR|nr:hypothetical protein BWQ96_10585 [Gracilariopsis chorda]PXF40053.1 hypothetical protein BWQ96_10241 [Gracilariopsis chorda]PXF44470.1 hypothetical protein BWQ96_05798 [Gracilariopsis chorda]|eukprot:PXF39713.1 hypothetical protein BWQ96_10585 [Gracilariopsis chorda]